MSLAPVPNTKGVAVELGRIAATEDMIDGPVGSSIRIYSIKVEGAELKEGWDVKGDDDVEFVCKEPLYVEAMAALAMA